MKALSIPVGVGVVDLMKPKSQQQKIPDVPIRPSGPRIFLLKHEAALTSILDLLKFTRTGIFWCQDLRLKF
jgi:hypothetical protein